MPKKLLGYLTPDVKLRGPDGIEERGPRMRPAGTTVCPGSTSSASITCYAARPRAGSRARSRAHGGSRDPQAKERLDDADR